MNKKIMISGFGLALAAFAIGGTAFAQSVDSTITSQDSKVQVAPAEKPAEKKELKRKPNRPDVRAGEDENGDDGIVYERPKKFDRARGKEGCKCDCPCCGGKMKAKGSKGEVEKPVMPKKPAVKDGEEEKALPQKPSSKKPSVKKPSGKRPSAERPAVEQKEAVEATEEAEETSAE